MNDSKDLNKELDSILRKLEEAEAEFQKKWEDADLGTLIRESEHKQNS